MDGTDLRRLIVRHRHVAPMLSVLLATTDARVTVTDLEGTEILDRSGDAGVGAAGAGAAGGPPVERHAILVEGKTVGWVSGPKPAGAIAAVLSYAAAREADKRALAHEALDRYRELNLIYDLADLIGADLRVDAVARVAVAEASRLPSGGTGFVFLRDADDPGRLLAHPADGEHPLATADADAGLLGAVLAGDPEIVNDVAGDARTIDAERAWASIAVAPLRVRGERIGVLGAGSSEPHVFTASDLKLLTAIASLAAPTFDQAAVHEAALRDMASAGLRPD